MMKGDHTHLDEKVVPVAVAPNEPIAELWRGLLEQEGITAMLKAMGPGAAYFSNFGYQHTLYVLESDAERARDILDVETEAEER
ncbi:putative signal transducing protein [Nitrolancea hollandica]|uniref:DUF2007 domain-containing protein n=1 Tax=Nitrolancea hollandica Lb TaxID=1129897 RepID=I4EN28_9BACT|nr:DUF2007 domain-containing protein [Nitrolancea hollandica]CCF86091.1 conserved hypothetical protein [Nitrolancea hollandica Lb]